MSPIEANNLRDERGSVPLTDRQALPYSRRNFMDVQPRTTPPRDVSPPPGTAEGAPFLSAVPPSSSVGQEPAPMLQPQPAAAYIPQFDTQTGTWVSPQSFVQPNAPQVTPEAVFGNDNLLNTTIEPQVVTVAGAIDEAGSKQKKSVQWKLPAIILGCIIGIGLVVVVVLAIFAGRVPGTIMQRALTSSLSKSEAVVQINNNGQIDNVTYDLSRLGDPRLSETGVVPLSSTYFSLEGYGSLNNTYIAYTQLGVTLPPTLTTKVAGNWVQLRNEGKLAPGINDAIASFSDPRSLLIQPWPTANMSTASASQYAQRILSSRALTFAAGAVKQITSAGQQLLSYPVTIHAGTLAPIEQNIMSSMGVPVADISSSLSQLAQSGNITGTLYINKRTDEIVRFDRSYQGHTMTYLYTSAQNATAPAPPATAVSWTQFAPLQSQIEQQVSLTESNSLLDSERKSDLATLQKFLQIYYSTSGQYPTLANMNDQVWVSSNLQGINPDVFEDPKGTSLMLAASPKANIFAYIPLSASGAANCNDIKGQANAIPCASYTLVATLSDNKEYSVGGPQ